MRLARAVRSTIVGGAWPAVLLLSCAAVAQAQGPDEHQAMTQPSGPTIVFRAFGSVDWGATRLPDSPNSFTIGQFDVFMTSTLSERVSVLAETVLEAGTNTRVVTDLERLELTFRMNDYFQLSAGRYHTGIGFYNAAFHHAAYFETVIGRPHVYEFEDEGGPLPVHEVGVSVKGVVPRTHSALRYLAEVGNGRRWDLSPSDSTVAQDNNGAKAVNLGASYTPDAWRGATIGVSHYRDSIWRPSAPSVPHQVTAAFLAYRTPSTEVLAEYLWIRHRADGATYDNHGAYVQASRAFGKLRPYYRYDRQDIDPATPFIGSLGSYKAHIVGLRVDPEELLGLKVQYERADLAGLHGVDTLRTQLVFVF